MSKLQVGAAAVAVLVVATTALAGAAATRPLGKNKRRPAVSFTLRGHVGGLFPGASRRLVIAVHNRSRRSLRVRSITTRVRDAKRGCRARNLRVSAFRGRLRIGPRRSRRVAVRVRMLPSAPAACQGAVFRLAFRGRATR